jgi:hypothetical protein
MDGHTLPMFQLLLLIFLLHMLLTRECFWSFITITIWFLPLLTCSRWHACGKLYEKPKRTRQKSSNQASTNSGEPSTNGGLSI